MNRSSSHALAALALAAAFGSGAALAQTPPVQAQARVISSTPITEQGRFAGYTVVYEYDGRRYTTRTDSPPGATLPVQVGAFGVTTYPVAPHGPVESAGVPPSPPAQDASGAPWDHVVPEPGVVVSAGQPAAAYPPPVYARPVYPAPVYAAPAYAYPQPYVYPPVGISLNLGYSRGWHRGGWHGHGGWRGRWR